ncbi:probable leucine-rich repeat receptor-like serine/threonine-protein kinase At3g14840 isoform X2 [Vigna radiata var. radiata]|uniref:non-specific serine/threonine protein kinase n=1 Tax=Vigna radiata var. radiata TaxID=3916 RepID=A0A1S3VXG6_VIGRR|nr:probable leucine-rich repeat receptor-like serine/threonine-protein kinase At3g14840 isoform X2 [Vigna radiata var. radiata]
MRSHCFFFFFIASFCFASFASGATLAQDEVEALRDIGKTLGKDWDFNVDPCSGESNWSTDGKNNVTCSCDGANGTVCHVTRIDLTRNYLNGTIPKEWGSTKLVTISLLGNRLTGEIPTEITNISTLLDLNLEANQFSGILPLELGNLTQIQRLLINSNKFTGELPISLARLSKLQDFRIGDNQFSGKIPDFIHQNLTNLGILSIVGSGLSGPIPSEISHLQNLTDLRITDLRGSETSTFPPVDKMKLEILILRNCNIVGHLPEYLGTMTIKDNLDLSFNKLTGPIPDTYETIARKTTYIYLTGNLLNGSLPSWIERAKSIIDISYNNLNITSQESATCNKEKRNLFANSITNGSGQDACLEGYTCSQLSYNLRINCGGKEVLVNKSTYDDDVADGGDVRFLWNRNRNWAVSTTGNYMNNNNETGTHLVSNKSVLSIENVDLYMTARASPISLTYYGFCLQNGNYTIILHFAEIVFTDDQTFSSLGRRLFDIYIQGELVQEGFNIAEEAGGNRKAITKKFTAVVSSKTLEIRLNWAGKGTTALPQRSVYGPLISAITVNSDNPPPMPNSISVGVVVGIVVAVVVVIILVFGIFWWKCCLRKKSSLEIELRGLELRTGVFTLRQIKVATNNFAEENKIGEGGFGPVYKGCLSDGTLIAVKLLSSKSRQGNREFLNEIGMISALQHPHLVKLYGCCVEGDHLLLVYEYMENNSLARALFGPEEQQIRLDWTTRYKICIGIARGLAYLHEESRLKVVHRDIKTTNVLLDKDLNPKISDFGLAKLDEEDNTHISTRIAGTYGYMAPEYAMHGYLTDKADVYSFGIVVLEIINGRNNIIHRQNEESFSILDWAHMLKEKGDLMELVDRRLGSNFKKEEVLVTIKVALLCTQVTTTLRPTMSSVVSILEGKSVVDEVVTEASEVLDEKRMEAMRKYYSELSIEVPWTASSTSASDLYPTHLDSSFLEKRNYL